MVVNALVVRQLLAMRYSDHALSRLKLLKAIRRWGPVARTDLPAHTGLSVGSITQMTAQLLDRGMIVENREAARRPGRPRQYLEINANGGMVLGANLGGVGLLNATFVKLSGERVHAVEVGLGMRASLEDMADAIGEALAGAIAASPLDSGAISRVAIALPALVDSDKGNIHFMTTFHAPAPVPFAAMIAQRLGLPVTIEHDLAGMARFEHWFGRARDLDTFTLIDVGMTVGVAEYIDGVPKSGTNGLNPEFGHIKSVTGADAHPCYCGAAGCLVAYASMFGILQSLGQLHDDPFPHTGTADERFARVIDQADAGNAVVRHALHQGATMLGIALANFITTNDPGHVLVTVASARFLAWLEQPLHEALQACTMPAILSATRIHLVVAEADWRWKGSAALALEQTFLGNG